ncbi:MAG TPA: hypothetical protein DD723_00055 [Candidatus Omnitrophica bacterium]|nr:MAG: hypothetical protein A2Z81_07275 [Omnitrophica WOR_2 bacterium GWA2_45_18]HBR13927.1 hypothetical protein [Candidatus Omnitrophota bacterium]
MRPAKHAIISAGVSLCLGVWMKDWLCGWACFLSGFFIDLDHHIDYFLSEKKIPFKYQELYDFCSDAQKGRIYLFFHSYELLALLWSLIFFLPHQGIWLGIVLGATVHVLCDQIFNPFKKYAYFFTYRMKYGFDKRKLFHEAFIQKKK